MWKIKRPLALSSLLIVSSALAAIWLVDGLEFARLINLKLSDLQFTLRGSTGKPPEIVLLTIDDAAMAAFPEAQLFWHRYYAKAIRAAADAGAKVLALDVAFAVAVDDAESGGVNEKCVMKPDAVEGCDPERDHDCVLAEAVDYARPKMPVVCAVVPALMSNPQAQKVPVNIMAMTDGLAAYANLTVDADDFVRRQKLLDRSSGKNCTEDLRGLALRTAEIYLGEDMRCDGDRLTLKGRIVPAAPQTEEGGDQGGPTAADTILVNYSGPPGTFARVSLATFLEAASRRDMPALKKWVENKIVLLGPDTEFDRHATPFYTSFGGPPSAAKGTRHEPIRWNTAGVEIHASTLHTLLNGTFIAPAPTWLKGLGVLAAAGGSFGLAQALKPQLFVPLLPFWIGGLVFLLNLLFRAGYVLSTLSILWAVLFSSVAAILARVLWAERRGHLFRNAIDKFVGRKVARSLEETGHLGLTGAQQNVTIMFSDIRGFTSYCESKTPEEVVETLNAYLKQMVGIIVAHQGAVNKFIGDGILVVFSDEDGTTPGDHAARAVRCGLAMTTAPAQFITGIGIHSGPVVIGNVGSDEKLEYTVLGETVNVASRIEGLNKDLKTQVLFSHNTWKMLPDTSGVFPLGAVNVRGLSAPLKVYTLAAVYSSESGATRS